MPMLLAAAMLMLAPGPTDEVVAAAEQAGVDPVELQGAVYSTGMAPTAYLIAVGELAAPGRSVRVRLTYYVEGGVTYSGGQTYPGSTACSWNFPLGTRFRMANGEVFTCNDRGMLGSSGWLDLWRRSDLSRLYGPYATVEVLP